MQPTTLHRSFHIAGVNDLAPSPHQEQQLFMSCRRRRLHGSRRAAMTERTAGPSPRALSGMLAPYHSCSAKN